MTEWDQYRDDQRERRIERLPIRAKEIESLSDFGYFVVKITPYQYRVDGLFDLYPIHNRWHNLKTNKRGGAKSLKDFIIKNIPNKPK